MTRVAVVTGAGSGLGQSICLGLAQAGHRVAVLDVNAEAAEKVAAELEAQGAQALAVSVDVSDEAAVENAFGAVREAFKITLDEWNRYLAVNLTGTFLSIRAALADMVAAKWGRIITISSAAGQQGAPGQGHYSATKGGVIALTKTVALDYAAKGITANTVPPFVIDTPLLREQQRVGTLPPTEFLTKAIPAGRLGVGEDVAALCTFLSSEAAGYITGQVIGVNGGAVI